MPVFWSPMPNCHPRFRFRFQRKLEFVNRHQRRRRPLAFLLLIAMQVCGIRSHTQFDCRHKDSQSVSHQPMLGCENQRHPDSSMQAYDHRQQELLHSH